MIDPGVTHKIYKTQYTVKKYRERGRGFLQPDHLLPPAGQGRACPRVGTRAPPASAPDLGPRWWPRVFPAMGVLSPKVWMCGDERTAGAGTVNCAAVACDDGGGAVTIRWSSRGRRPVWSARAARGSGAFGGGVVEARGDAGVGSPRRGWRRGEMSRRPRMEWPVAAVAVD